VLARFTTPDTIVPNPRDPQDLNRYSYVNNNPLRYTDPTGHFKLGKFLKSVFKPLDTFLQNNAWARWATWAIAPGMMMNVDPSTRTRVWAAGAGFAVGGPIGGFSGAVLGGAAAGAAGAPWLMGMSFMGQASVLLLEGWDTGPAIMGEDWSILIRAPGARRLAKGPSSEH
jgi:hypothetical protein